MTEQLFSIQSQDGYLLNTKVIEAKNDAIGVIVYYHGGGLIFGNPEDLSSEIIDVLTQSFHLVLAPYRLAPEAKFNQIISDALSVYDFIKQHYSKLPVFTYGRSSGGYLAIQVAHQRTADGILDFYGFSQINIPEFYHEHTIFKKQTSKLSEAMIQFMLQSAPVTVGHAQLRYPLYLYTRGNGKWYEYVGIENYNNPYYNLSIEALQALPPIFIAHAQGDIDVPFSESEHIAKHAPHSQLVMIPADEHDFDRISNDTVLKTYKEAVQFLKQFGLQTEG